MTIETEYEIGSCISHADEGLGVVERIEIDIEGNKDPVILYHIKFDRSGETAMYFEFDIEAI